MKTLREQYKLVQSARGVLFDYLATIPFQKLHQPVEAFNNKSVCFVLNHIALSYLSWLNEFALKIPLLMTDETAWQTMDDVRTFYTEVNDAAYNFVSSFDDKDTMITAHKKRQKQTFTFSVLELFTHVVTHEFHHKGMIVNMTRQLGFTPVDTDIIRF
ncbi:MAG: DinB family protein [Bacteroidota bacterium]|nr:DinB family protein [Bacteroidota bacterium]